MTSRAANRAKLYLREWRLLAVLLLALVAWLSMPNALPRVNYLVQDASLRLAARPASPDIAIVAIDDRSIEAIGRWPWPRALHAALLSRLSAQSPRAVGLDILFLESDADHPDSDDLLADALRYNGRTVLPVERTSQGGGDSAGLPIAPLAQSTSQLGHVHVQVDPDGLARSVFLQEGPQAYWPHFSRAMLCAGAAAVAPCRDGRSPQPQGAWEQTEQRIIAFASGATPFTTYSYVDVLKGHIPEDTLRGKYVLVGVTGTGLGDQFSAPVEPQGGRRVPGVEILAHVLNGELQGLRIQPAPVPWNILFALLPVMAALLAVRLLNPFWALASTAGLFVSTLAASLASPSLVGWQLAPAGGLLGLLLLYPLWSWRRLSAAAEFLQREMRTLSHSGLPQLDSVETDAAHGSSDFLGRRINAVDRASEQLRQLHSFVSASLQQLPSPTFVCNGQGQITLANAAAMRYAESVGTAQPEGHALAVVLQGLTNSDNGAQLLQPGAGQLAHMPAQQNAQDARGRRLLVLCKRFSTGQPEAGGGWLLTLVDLTDLHEAQRQRNQAMQFISHDIRAPNASILTLLEMKREYPDLIPDSEFMARIERCARNSLDMADSFLNLATAQAQTYELVPLDLVNVVCEAVDDAWAFAQERQVQLNSSIGVEHACCTGHRALIHRAIGNVVQNAIKFSPEGASVDCALIDDGLRWLVTVRDAGPGIPESQRARLFKPFERLHQESHPSISGLGLGLALTDAVVRRHGGEIKVLSEVGRGSEFQLAFPKTHEGFAEHAAALPTG